jgi:hypothetical protein
VKPSNFLEGREALSLVQPSIILDECVAVFWVTPSKFG